MICFQWSAVLKNCSSVGPLHGVQSFRNRLDLVWVPSQAAGVCQASVPAWNLHKSAASWAYLPALSIASLSGLSVVICSSVVLSMGCRAISIPVPGALFSSLYTLASQCTLVIFYSFLKYYYWDVTSFADSFSLRQPPVSSHRPQKSLQKLNLREPCIFILCFCRKV